MSPYWIFPRDSSPALLCFFGFVLWFVCFFNHEMITANDLWSAYKHVQVFKCDDEMCVNMLLIRHRISYDIEYIVFSSSSSRWKNRCIDRVYITVIDRKIRDRWTKWLWIELSSGLQCSRLKAPSSRLNAATHPTSPSFWFEWLILFFYWLGWSHLS